MGVIFTINGLKSFKTVIQFHNSLFLRMQFFIFAGLVQFNYSLRKTPKAIKRTNVYEGKSQRWGNKVLSDLRKFENRIQSPNCSGSTVKSVCKVIS